ncbi:G-protein subunit alpha 6, partial [Reticulomyxa filosa]
MGNHHYKVFTYFSSNASSNDMVLLKLKLTVYKKLQIEYVQIALIGIGGVGKTIMCKQLQLLDENRDDFGEWTSTEDKMNEIRNEIWVDVKDSIMHHLSDMIVDISKKPEVTNTLDISTAQVMAELLRACKNREFLNAGTLSRRLWNDLHDSQVFRKALRNPSQANISLQMEYLFDHLDEIFIEGEVSTNRNFIFFPLSTSGFCATQYSHSFEVIDTGAHYNKAKQMKYTYTNCVRSAYFISFFFFFLIYIRIY